MSETIYIAIYFGLGLMLSAFVIAMMIVTNERDYKDKGLNIFATGCAVMLFWPFYFLVIMFVLLLRKLKKKETNQND